VHAHQRLVTELSNLDAKVRFVTLYQLILEGTLGLTTFKFTIDYLSGEGPLPGFVDGHSKIHHDETRHIGYGVWFLRASVHEYPQTEDVIRQTLRDLLPSVSAALAPPDTGSNLDFAAIAATNDAIREFALGGLTR
jgi:ribonucleoside-diphosphate reductase beta chain